MLDCCRAFVAGPEGIRAIPIVHAPDVQKPIVYIAQTSQQVGVRTKCQKTDTEGMLGDGAEEGILTSISHGVNKHARFMANFSYRQECAVRTERYGCKRLDLLSDIGAILAARRVERAVERGRE